MGAILVTNLNRMTFELRSNGGNYGGAEWIAAEGEIATDTDIDLEKFLKSFGHTANPGGWSVRLNSPGGSLEGGVRLGEMIRKLKLDTEVGATEPDEYGHWKRTKGQCASAASFAFLGGLERDVEDGQLGVHQFYYEIALKTPSEKLFSALDVSEHQLITAALIDYTARMGVDPRFVSAAASTNPKKMDFLDRRRLDDLNVRWHPKEFHPWLIEPEAEGVVAITRTRDEELTAKFFCRSDLVPILQIQTKIEDWKWVKDAMNTITKVSAFDLSYPNTALTAKNVGGFVVLEYRLPAMDGAKVSSANWSGVLVEGPKYMWGGFTYKLTKENAEKAIRIALRNAI